MLLMFFGCAETQRPPQSTEEPNGRDDASVPSVLAQRTPDTPVSHHMDMGPQDRAEEIPPVAFADLPPDPQRTKVQWSDFVGSEVCGECHVTLTKNGRGRLMAERGGNRAKRSFLSSMGMSFDSVCTVTLLRNGTTPFLECSVVLATLGISLWSGSLGAA